MSAFLSPLPLVLAFAIPLVTVPALHVLTLSAVWYGDWFVVNVGTVFPWFALSPHCNVGV